VSQEAAEMENLVQPEQVAATATIKRSFYILGGTCALLLLAFLFDWRQTSVLFARFWAPSTSISLTHVTAIPGDTIVPQDEPLVIAAKLEQRKRESATLTIRNADNPEGETLPLLPSENADADFEHQFAAVTNSFEYRIRSGDGQTAWHSVTVAKRPELTAIDFRITPPEYSELPTLHEKGLPRKARALEGSTLTVDFQSSIPLKQMQLRMNGKRLQTLEATPDGNYRFHTKLTQPLSLSPLLTSEHDLANKRPPVCRIAIFRDRAPAVQVVTPNDEIAVRPDDTIKLEFLAKDDFGIAKAELVVFDPSSNDEKELKVIDIPLGDQQDAKELHAQTELDLKQFNLKHGSQLAYAVRVFDTKQSAASSKPGDSNSAQSMANASGAQPSESLRKTRTPQDADQLAKANGKNSQQSGTQQSSSNNKNEASKSDGENAERLRKKSDNANDNSGSGSSSKNQLQSLASKDSEPSPPAGKQDGAPKPGNDMAHRLLDVEGSQCTTCKRLRLTIDEWAGSFEGQARKKLQLAIDPYLKQLDEKLAAAEKIAKILVKHTQAADDWTEQQTESTEKSDKHLDDAELLIVKLQNTSENTPYAFIGLQLVEIGHSHVIPARENFLTVLNPKTADKKQDIAQADHHIQRARELLAQLSRRYAAVKINEKIAEEMVHVKKMHQVFIEGVFALLGSKKPLLNPKSRSFVELDIDEEFRTKLREFL